MATIPSLALLPSGYKASKVYSVLPTDGSGDFTFTRSGNATRVNSEGLIELVTTNVPRLNYPLIDGVVSGCPSLLLEPQRINLITYSEDFTQSVWSDLRVSLTSNNAISPDGTLNASELTLDATNDSHTLIHSTITGLSANANHTISVFVKSNGNDKVALRDASVGNYISVDLSNGVILDENNINSSIEKFGNDWYRISLTFLSSSSGQIRPSLYLLKDNYTSGSPSSAYLGDGVSSVYVWGFQAEANSSYATFYIPTSGTIGTRSAETCNNAGDVNTFNDSEGVLMAEISALADDGTARVITINDGGSSDYIGLRYHTVSNTVRFLIKSGGTINFDYFITLPSTLDSNKIAIKYDNTNVYLWANGIQYFQYSPITTPIGLSTLDFDDSLGNDDFYGKTKQLQYFDSALNDSDLETLTSWDSFSDMAIGQLYTIE
jgi:hypothetical protein